MFGSTKTLEQHMQLDNKSVFLVKVKYFKLWFYKEEKIYINLKSWLSIVLFVASVFQTLPNNVLCILSPIIYSVIRDLEHIYIYIYIRNILVIVKSMNCCIFTS